MLKKTSSDHLCYKQLAPSSTKKNITSEEEKALRDLAKDKSVTILPVDKGRAVVVMNTNDYTEKVNNPLNDDKTYQKITDKRRNPT